ncbi:MAG: hypothetical protein IT176_15775 [Acidobacteria bacterium]|nr:hypothetical protein [Acidobacteriota bacterium]
MGDAGEGLIDAESRIQERMEEVERGRTRTRRKDERVNPEHARTLESLKLARLELDHQLAATTHERRRVQLAEAIKEVERRIVEASARLAS